MHNETLKAICNRILQADGGMNEDLIQQIERLYEEALLEQFLQIRQRKMADIHQNVRDRAASIPSPEAPVPTPAPQPDQSAAAKYGDEVKVLPHPEGPPKPTPREEPILPVREEKATPPPAPEPEITQEPVKEPVAPKEPVSHTEELRRVLEERTVPSEPAQSPSNPRLAKLNIGLNDRIAFVKQLFMGSQEDYQRVISQINTMDEYGETIDFIENVVKPDYDWSSVEETEQRLLDLVANRFNR